MINARAKLIYTWYDKYGCILIFNVRSIYLSKKNVRSILIILSFLNFFSFPVSCLLWMTVGQVYPLHLTWNQMSNFRVRNKIIMLEKNEDPKTSEWLIQQFSLFSIFIMKKKVNLYVFLTCKYFLNLKVFLILN